MQVEKEKLLVVEGKDEEAFFEVFLNHKEIDGVQIIRTDGRNKLSSLLSALVRASGFDEVTSLFVVQDADDSVENRFRSVQSSLEKNDLPVPKELSSSSSRGSLATRIFIIDKMLESLCMKTVSGDGIFQCIESFMSCAEEKRAGGKSIHFPKNQEKARCRAFLSLMEEDTPSLGVAAKKGYWGLDSDCLKPLEDFLKKM